MKKLFKLKNWLTLEETSRRLSTVFEEQVSVADCLQLAVDGHIVISALLTTDRYAVRAKVISSTLRDILDPEHNSKVGEDIYIDNSDRTYKAEYLESYYDHITKSDEIITIPSGVWDLPMIGSEILDVEHALAQAQGRNTDALVRTEGIFVKDGDDLFHIMEMHSGIELRVNDNKQVEIYDKDFGDFVPYEEYQQFFYSIDNIENVDLVFRRENIELFENSQLDATNMDISLSESLEVIGTMLDAIKNVESKAKRWTQELLKFEMEERNPSLKKRRIDDYFSLANKCYKSID